MNKKQILYLIVVFLFIYFVLKNLNSGKDLLSLLTKAKWQFVLLALILQSVHFVLTGILYSKTFKLYDINWKFGKVIKLVFASLSLNLFAPLAPFPGSGLFIQRARKDNFPALNVAAAIFLVVLADYVALTPLLALSLLFQFENQKLFNYEIVGVFVFLFIILLLFLILAFGVLSPGLLKGLFWLFETITNKLHHIFKKRNFFIGGWHESRTEQFIELSKKILSSKTRKRDIFITAFLKHLVDIFTLFLLFLAFGTLIPITTLFVGYSLMILFWIVTPTPQGVGFVEVIAPAIFSSMGIGIETSTLTVLAFRGLNLWLPVMIGFSALHSLVKDSSK
jgi:glycosyltransferase 2 family protein